MNPHKFFASADLISNPLCGIDTYKDILNLATGTITRKIKKLVLTGEEDWLQSGAVSNTFYINVSGYLRQKINITLCSHYTSQANINGAIELQDGNVSFYANTGQPFEYFYVRDSNLATVADFKSYLATQYAADTPVTIWYVLAQSETEQITVPTGLSGNVEGYMIQDGTPTPAAPIYPTANTAKGWYDINAYKRSVLVWNTDTAYERSDGSWT